MTRLSVSELRSQLSDVLSIIAFRGESFVIQRNGRDIAAIVPIADIEFVEDESGDAEPDASPSVDTPLTDAEIAEVERAIGIRTE